MVMDYRDRDEELHPKVGWEQTPVELLFDWFSGFFVSFVIGHSNDFGFVFTREFYGTNEKHSICNYDHTGILLVRPDYNGF